MRHNITKSFDFCYGHRVHNQKLNPDYSIDTCLVCRHLHGHQGQVIIKLGAEKLTDGMVTDFKHLGWFKEWVDDTLDHKMIMDIEDPVLSYVFPVITQELVDDYKNQFSIRGFTSKDSLFLHPKVYDHLPEAVQEIYDGLVVVNFVPTSENISEWLFQVIEDKMKSLGITVVSVEFKETPKTSATYYGL